MEKRCWFRYVYDIFVVWSHGEEELGRFLTHFNSVQPRIQFILEREANGQLVFLNRLADD